MHLHRSRTTGEQALIGSPRIGVIEKLYPKQDFAILHRRLQMGGMASDKPPAEGYI
jgi:hypothetical protein